MNWNQCQVIAGFKSVLERISKDIYEAEPMNRYEEEILSASGPGGSKSGSVQLDCTGLRTLPAKRCKYPLQTKNGISRNMPVLRD